MIDGRPVTSASSFGRVLTDIDLTLGRNGDVEVVTADNIPMYADGPHAGGGRRRAGRALRRPLGGRCASGEVGRITDIGRSRATADDSGENQAGNLIADAQLADTDDAGRGDAVGALMNPGGVRADFVRRQRRRG